MQRDPSPGRRVACNSPSEGTRFHQSCQSRPEHPGVSDGNQSCCWWNSYTTRLDCCSPLYPSMTLQIKGIRYDISRNPTWSISTLKVPTTRNIARKLCVYDLETSSDRRPVSWAATVLASYWAPPWTIIGLIRIHAPVTHRYWSNYRICFWWSLGGDPGRQKAHRSIVSRRSTFIISCSEAQSDGYLTMPQWRSIRPIVVFAVLTAVSFSSLVTTLRRWCAWLLCGIWYISTGI